MPNKKTNKAYKIKVGENIRTWRELKGLKQVDLAKRIAISPEALSNIETGVSKPNIERLEDIADALEIEINQLLVNPQQLFTFNINPGSNVLQHPQNQNFDKDLLDRLMYVMEKMTLFFTSPNRQKTN
ncbi:MAG: helix-turn-helix transcriptional regulator [Chitinophagaceae bacterium]|nr:helix-turn-helix transcriptional regulator [Chitinophagaceae bacterium]